MTENNEATTKVEQIQNLMFDGMTRKQAAIVATFEDHPDESLRRSRASRVMSCRTTRA